MKNISILMMVLIICCIGISNGDTSGEIDITGSFTESVDTDLTGATVLFVKYDFRIDMDFPTHNYYQYNIYNAKFDKKIDYDDIPASFQEPIIWKDLSTGYTVFTGTTVFSKQSDIDSNYCYVDVAYYFTSVNTTFMTMYDNTGQRHLPATCDKTLFSLYFDEWTKRHSSTQATSIYDTIGLEGKDIGGEDYESGSWLLDSNILYSIYDSNELWFFLNVTKNNLNVTTLIEDGYNNILYEVTDTNDFNNTFFNQNMKIDLIYDGAIYNIYNTVNFEYLNAKILDRSNNHIINNVSISYYVDENMKDIETVDGIFTKQLSTDINKIQLGKSGYSIINYTIDLNSQNNYIFYLTDIALVYTDSCTIYGNIYNFATNDTIENVHLTLSNNSYSDSQYSNEYGAYVFYNLTNTTYNLSCYAYEYHPSEFNIIIPDLNTAVLNDVYLSSITAIITPTPHPTTSIGLPLYNEDDIWDWLHNYIWYIFLIILGLFIYSMYVKSGLQKRFK